MTTTTTATKNYDHHDNNNKNNNNHNNNKNNNNNHNNHNNQNNKNNNNNHNNKKNNNNTSSGWRVCFCRRPAVRRKPHKSGQGLPGRGIAEGVSLLSVGERGRAPCRRHLCPPKTVAFYGVLCSSHFFSFFGACGSRWVNMGQHRRQEGRT